MKRIFYFTLLFFVTTWLLSCKKESTILLSETFVKQIKSDIDFASLGIIPLDDGNYVIAGFEYRAENSTPRNPPRVIKIDIHGNIVWDKRIPQSGTTLYKILPVTGSGFLTLGVADFNSSEMELCVYNYNGDLASSHKIGLHSENNKLSSFDMIQLSNGNYAFAGYDYLTGTGILKIVNSNFDSLYYSLLSPSDSIFNVLIFHKLCETPDGSIALAASTYLYTPVSISLMTAIVRTDLNGVKKSFEVLADSNHWETPNAITYHNNSLVVPAAKYSTNWQSGYGCEVNYDLRYNGPNLGSGRISIERFNNDGVFIERKDIYGYPRNGLIHSMHPTRDGGFICCGTVDQANSYYMLSDTKMYLLKLDANLNMQWSKTIQTTYQAFGVEAIQTPDDGYLISSFQRSMDSRFQMMVIKTDENGNY